MMSKRAVRAPGPAGQARVSRVLAVRARPAPCGTSTFKTSRSQSCDVFNTSLSPWPSEQSRAEVVTGLGRFACLAFSGQNRQVPGGTSFMQGQINEIKFPAKLGLHIFYIFLASLFQSFRFKKCRKDPNCSQNSTMRITTILFQIKGFFY